MTHEPKYPDVEVQISGEDGNAGSIMGRVTRALKANGATADELSEFRVECMSGDYNNLLRTVSRWVSVA